MSAPGTVELDEDGMFVIECPSIPGCVSQGKSEQEAVENIKDAIRQCLQVRAEKGMPLTVNMREVEVIDGDDKLLKETRRNLS